MTKKVGRIGSYAPDIVIKGNMIDSIENGVRLSGIRSALQCSEPTPLRDRKDADAL
jgi:hypothetical protein